MRTKYELRAIIFFFEKQMLYICNTNSITEEETAKQGPSKRTTSQHKPTWNKLEPIEKQQQEPVSKNTEMTLRPQHTNTTRT